MANLQHSFLHNWTLILLPTVAALGCSPHIDIAQGDAGVGTGGAQATGGAASTGGSWHSNQTGGAAPTGGNYATGGSNPCYQYVGGRIVAVCDVPTPTGGSEATGGAPSDNTGGWQGTGGDYATGGAPPNGQTCICALANSLGHPWPDTSIPSCSSNTPDDCTLEKAYCGQTCEGQPLSCSTDCVASFAVQGFLDSSTYTSGTCTVTINCPGGSAGTGGSPGIGGATSTGGAATTGGVTSRCDFGCPTGGAVSTGGLPATGGYVATGGAANQWNTPPNGHTCICALAESLTETNQDGSFLGYASCSSNTPSDCTLEKAYCGQTCNGQPLSCGNTCIAGFSEQGFLDSSTYTSGSCTTTIHCP